MIALKDYVMYLLGMAAFLWLVSLGMVLLAALKLKDDENGRLLATGAAIVCFVAGAFMVIAAGATVNDAVK